MRRHKRKPASRRYADYSAEKLEEAIRAIQSKSLTLRKASKRYNISLGTLSRKCRNLHPGKYGRPAVLSIEEEQKIVEGLHVVAQWGFPLTTRDLQQAVHSYLEKIGRRVHSFKENRPGKDWVYYFQLRHPELTKRFSENIKRNRAEVSAATISDYFDNLQISLEGVSPEGIINYDESNLCDDPGRTKVLVKRGMKHPERCLDSSKASTSIVVACSASGCLLPLYVIYKAEHLYDCWTERGPKGARYNRTKSGWMDGKVFEDWFMSVILPYFKRLGPGPKALIGDNLSSHLSEDVIKQCQLNNIRFILLPANSTHLCQPLDVAFFRPLKAAWRRQLLKWKLANKGCIPKSQFPSLLRETLDTITENQENIIKSGFRATGIYPLDRNQVLKRLPDGVNDNLNETALSEALKDQLKTMRYGKEVPKEKKKKRLTVVPGKSISAVDESSDTEVEVSLHDSDSSVGPLQFSDEDDGIAGPSAALTNSSSESNGEENTEKRTATPELSDHEEQLIKEGDFLLVAFPVEQKKNKYLNYVGEVLKIIEQGSSYECKFLRPFRMSKTVFIYPEIDDICEIEKSQIIENLCCQNKIGSKVIFNKPV